ncbi:MAG TPA: hypothetical protein VK785_04575 [Opitutaceae bacterium]|jgi:NhaP-type Na+/H+ or K+/H+ antiporter|nr:hypothetical protein [Opitutaceae bacterium]
MKRTLLAFALAPLIPATIFGLANAINVLLRPETFSGTAPALGGFLVGFLFGAAVSCAVAWTLGVLVFLVLRSVRKEGWLSYSLAGLLLGATYAFFTKQERIGGDLAFYFTAFCFFGLSSSVGFWAIRRKGLSQHLKPATTPAVP